MFVLVRIKTVLIGKEFATKRSDLPPPKVLLIIITVIDRKVNGSHWRNSFPPRVLQEMTAKGKYKAAPLNELNTHE